MPLIFQSFICRADLKHNPWTLYVFGDNLKRVGSGGQAREMRGEPNAIGLPTKRSPGSYLCDIDLPEIKRVNRKSEELLHHKLFVERGAVVWPLKGIGTGLAQLYTHAPTIMQYYADFLQKLEASIRAGEL